jgi:HAD superfamily hydrolase (TIGR01509 family)
MRVKGLIKAICFDMDGVLVDAADWHYTALNLALKHVGCHISYEEHLSVYNGLPTHKKLELLSAKQGLPTTLHAEIHQLKQKYTQAEIALKCRPDPEKIHLLSVLKIQGYQLAVCSNSIRSSMSLILTQSRLIDYFDFILSAEDVSAPKPSPDIYLKAIKHLNRQPHEIIAVEDTSLGATSARQAGLAVLQVSAFSEVNLQTMTQVLPIAPHPAMRL